MKNNNIFEHLEIISKFIPSAFYWKDLNSKFLGANNAALDMVGLKKSDIGKTDFDIWPKEFAEKFVADDKRVISTGKLISMEDRYTDVDGNIKYCHVIKSPLYDENNNLIGIIGNSIDITAEKEAQQLKIEKESYKTEVEKQKLLSVIEEQEKFRKIVNQVAHDIGSPIFAINAMLSSCDDLAEDVRNIFRLATERIRDIATNLLNHYKPIDELLDDVAKPTLVLQELLDILAEKKVEYLNYRITFNHSCSDESKFAFINAHRGMFKRMLSNLINNAVEAVNTKSNGQITINLDVIEDQIRISIEDNGIGMPEEVKAKILNKVAITSGKTGGHGIGFGQVLDTLTIMNGTLEIDSKVGHGSKIALVLPKIEEPEWICTKISVKLIDTIVIVDDDKSIHGAWDSKFEKLGLKDNCTHFEQGIDAINFINSLADKDNILLFTDYELIRQNITGLDIIKQTRIKRSILVTSHYNDENIHNLAKELYTKILPKSLASEVTILLC